jgi:hypothetical protein
MIQSQILSAIESVIPLIALLFLCDWWIQSHLYKPIRLWSKSPYSYIIFDWLTIMLIFLVMLLQCIYFILFYFINAWPSFALTSWTAQILNTAVCGPWVFSRISNNSVLDVVIFYLIFLMKLSSKLPIEFRYLII